MVLCAVIRASTTSRAPLDSFDYLRVIDRVVVAQTFRHFLLRLNTWQESR